MCAIKATDVAAYLTAHPDALAAIGAPPNAVVKVKDFARGEYNLNFSLALSLPATPPVQPAAPAAPAAPVASFLFRINLGSQMHLENQIRYEARALALLEQSGRVPRVHYVDDSGAFMGRGVLIEDLLSGRPLIYATDLELAAHILADIHSVAVPPRHGLLAPARPLQSILTECEALFAVYRGWRGARAPVLELLERLFDTVRHVVAREAAGAGQQASARRHIISTEVNSGNFLINDGGDSGGGGRGGDGGSGTSYLIDWEKPVIGPVEQDLAHFLIPTTTYWKTDVILDAQQVEQFLAAYEAAVADRFDTCGLRARLSDFLTTTSLRGLTWCAMAYAQHKQGIRSVADPYTLAKIETYLAPDFMELAF